ncbi:bifunctional 2-keto-4-hydroxyglutarate aldolase/2-keto-3-deoxy-6-phosphogluconate aldolase [Clostridium gasigenes]|uniref:bifunctional 2-keto-4-hydroxyglutarate aldolase/2-keto-3-deoxy-6-phosphogluconate aldolase n=1 Tax=Clostridium gasigenes TaxID=94869 RepID=UPI0014382798|nr:bifunctional 2-keto-4-hydroxyglutarate aldolase/2-keto-3-deoxy-6-phosphogluconate aldolase [Clostridium gasigenes]MBU3135523.1 bifunctional 2-keto-4-hydroxyglutarate aldolase/2-keto-3-deoxy-6-phosphogluconate aldolase [Clostridium gasigenes]NKF05895.1 bifunctional 2-keto-4-hydroxyglutarate aldolase/2-keto-3-deoxy-6-phosphogluconate aldolase [Clostridium gasigenes]QSW19376.1 bifunctional 2-keto-4-hydroxyglutarate aldolase/2-keto-3-deoxy-6-phosphogluconate aldolase [Clostridium gasigenes]
MLNKIKVLNRVKETGVVAVIRGQDVEEAIKIASSSVEGGIDILEITFTVPKANTVIERLVDMYGDKVVVGAGTVLDSETARFAILSGAQFIVGPNFDLETAKLCNKYAIPYMAGCMTINEIIKAMEAGTDVIKLFPGSAYGPSMINDIKAPLPQITIMPTGGVSLDNVHEWIGNGCIAVGVGGALTAPAKTGDYKKISEVARQFVEKVKESREAV